MLAAILSWLSGPFVGAALKAYTAKLDAGNTAERIAADLAARELAVQQRETEVHAEYKRALIGHWYEPVNLLAYIIVAYIGKVVVWDTMLGLGTTPAIKGDVAAWMGMVMLFLVGKRGFENVASILRRK
jgi:hypothetical protein